MQILIVPVRRRLRVHRLGALGETKAQGLNAWIDANAAIEAVEKLLFTYSTQFRDNAYWVFNETSTLRAQFDARRAEVETYGEWTTRWSKYIKEANDWATKANGLLAQMNSILLQLPPPGQGGDTPTPPPPPPPGKDDEKKEGVSPWLIGGVSLVVLALVVAAARKR